MARNKHPEETVHLILDTACRLFLKKGYEHTSIQDIIDNLGGLSKGAIYHHFKSKEDILAAVTDQMTSESNQMLAAIRDRSDLNGREKLRTLTALFRIVSLQLLRILTRIPNCCSVFCTIPLMKRHPVTFFRLFSRELQTVLLKRIIRSSWLN